MVTKENKGYVGNSLLQTASNKRLGAGRFALLALKGNPKPPVKKVKIPVLAVQELTPKNPFNNVDATDDRSKISDMTISVGESTLLSRPALVKEVQLNSGDNNDDEDVESSVLGMSMQTGLDSSSAFSATRAYFPNNKVASNMAQNTNKGNKNNNKNTRNPFENIGPSIRTNIQPRKLAASAAYQQHPSQKTVSASLSHPKGRGVKKSLVLNKGIVFSAPSPMTLHRFEVQRGRERNAPESKEYLEQQAQKEKQKQRQLEREHAKQAKLVVRQELKRVLQREQGEGFEAQLNEDEYEVAGAAMGVLQKKTLMKRILGKIRPKPPIKRQQEQQQQQQQHEVAPQQPRESPEPKKIDQTAQLATLDKETASNMVRKALLASKQRTGLGSGTIEQPIMVASPHSAVAENGSHANVFAVGVSGALASAQNALAEEGSPSNVVAVEAPSALGGAAGAAAAATADVDAWPSGSVPFPVSEIFMQPKQDSISDLDASFRQAPVMEILMCSRDPQSRNDDESVSTLGTPRVFQKLDPLEGQRNPDPPEVTPVASMPPPDMVISSEANPLIDQMESADKSGEKSAGTSAVDKEAAMCGEWFIDPPKTFNAKSTRTTPVSDEIVHNENRNLNATDVDLVKESNGRKIRAAIGDVGEEGVEAEIAVSPSNKDFLLGDRPMFDAVQVMSPQTDASQAGETTKSAFSMALDQAIQEAAAQPLQEDSVVSFPDAHLQTTLSPIEEEEEIASPRSAVSPESEENQKQKLESKRATIIDLTDAQYEDENLDFEPLMEIAASKLETDDNRRAQENADDKCIITQAGATKKSAFTIAVEQAMRKAAAQPQGESVVLFPDIHLQASLSSIWEQEESASARSDVSTESEEMGRQELGRKPAPIIDLTSGQYEDKSLDFEPLMTIAASRLETGEDRYAVENDGDEYNSTNPFDDAPRDSSKMRLEGPHQVIVGRLVDPTVKDDVPVVQGFEVSPTSKQTNDLVTPRTRGARTQLFDLTRNGSSISSKNFEIYENDEGEMVICSDDPRKLPRSPCETIGTRSKPRSPLIEEEPFLTLSEGLFDLLPSDDLVSKKEPNVEERPETKASTRSKPRSQLIEKEPTQTFSEDLFDLLSSDDHGSKQKKILEQSFEEVSGGPRKERPEIKAIVEEDIESNDQNDSYDVEGGDKVEVVATYTTKEEDALEHVFEYSEMIVCGGTSFKKKKSGTMASSTPVTGSVLIDEHNTKAAAMCGVFPFSRVVGDIKSNTTALPDIEQGVSKEIGNIKPQSDVTMREYVPVDVPETPDRPPYRAPDDNLRNVEKNPFVEIEIEPRTENIADQDTENEKMLLDHDDAYWDTLSTIASTTKDKSSSDSEKYLYEAVIPGPIPVEITTQTSKDVEIKPRAGASRTAYIDHMSQTPRSRNQQVSSTQKIARIGILSGDDEIRSPQVGASRSAYSDDYMTQTPRSRNQQVSSTQKLARIGILSGDDEIRTPQSRGAKSEDGDTRSLGSKVARLIAIFESNSTVSGTISTKETPGANSSTDGSGLLQSVTRSDNGGNETSVNLPSVGEPNLEEDKSSLLPETTSCSVASQESIKSKCSKKPCPEVLMESSKKSKQSNKSNRSVSWGFEEIYEAPKQLHRIVPGLSEVDEVEVPLDAGVFPKLQDPLDTVVDVTKNQEKQIGQDPEEAPTTEREQHDEFPEARDPADKTILTDIAAAAAEGASVVPKNPKHRIGSQLDFSAKSKHDKSEKFSQLRNLGDEAVVSAIAVKAVGGNVTKILERQNGPPRNEPANTEHGQHNEFPHVRHPADDAVLLKIAAAAAGDAVSKNLNKQSGSQHEEPVSTGRGQSDEFPEVAEKAVLSVISAAAEGSAKTLEKQNSSQNEEPAMTEQEQPNLLPRIIELSEAVGSEVTKNFEKQNWPPRNELANTEHGQHNEFPHVRDPADDTVLSEIAAAAAGYAVSKNLNKQDGSQHEDPLSIEQGQPDEFPEVYDPAEKAVLSTIATAAEGSASKTLGNQTCSQNEEPTMTEQEQQNLLARIIELSKDLFGYVGAQDLKEEDEEVVNSLFSFGLPRSTPENTNNAQFGSSPLEPISPPLTVGSATNNTPREQQNWPQHDEPPTTEQEQQNLLARTIELSNDLFGSIGVRNIKDEDEEVVESLLSSALPSSALQSAKPHIGRQNVEPISPPTSIKSEISQHSPINVEDLYDHFNSQENDRFVDNKAAKSFRSPSLSKLDMLRKNRNSPINVEDFYDKFDVNQENDGSVDNKAASSFPTKGLRSHSFSKLDLLREKGNSSINVEDLCDQFSTNQANDRSADNKTVFTFPIKSFRSPSLSKLDLLREKRTKALERFQLANQPISSSAVGLKSYPSATHSKIDVPHAIPQGGRDRDHLRYYSVDRTNRTTEHLRATVMSPVSVTRQESQTHYSTGWSLPNQHSYNDRDAEVLSVASSTSSAPSRKARELRKQLDEALKTSQEIRHSQEQLGTELRSFKSRYYRKNDAIEDHAFRAVGGRSSL